MPIIPKDLFMKMAMFIDRGYDTILMSFLQKKTANAMYPWRHYVDFNYKELFAKLYILYFPARA